MAWFVVASVMVHGITLLRINALSARLFMLERTGKGWREQDDAR